MRAQYTFSHPAFERHKTRDYGHASVVLCPVRHTKQEDTAYSWVQNICNEGRQHSTS